VILLNKFSFVLLIAGVVAVTVLTIPSKLKLGKIYLASYDYEKAYELLKDAKKKKSRNLEVNKKLRDYFLVQGNTKEACLLKAKKLKISKKS
jgi:hypothetical protein